MKAQERADTNAERKPNFSKNNMISDGSGSVERKAEYFMKNKKKLLVIAVVLVAVVAAVGLIAYTQLWRYPFRNLQAEDIQSVKYHIEYFSADEPIYRYLPEEKTEEFVGLMRELCVRGFSTKKNRNEVGGKTYMFVITKTDGSQQTVCASDPYVLIDGKAYDGSTHATSELFDFWAALVPTGRQEFFSAVQQAAELTT